VSVVLTVIDPFGSWVPYEDALRASPCTIGKPPEPTLIFAGAEGSGKAHASR
jgi:hypothetical protein